MGVRARQAPPPGPASSRIRSALAATGDGQGRPLDPSFPLPFPSPLPHPPRAHPHSSPRRRSLPRALAARVFPPWPGDRQLLRVTAAQPETSRPAVESMQALASGSGDESLRPVSVVPTFVPSRLFCGPQSPSLTPHLHSPVPELEPIVRVPSPRRRRHQKAGVSSQACLVPGSLPKLPGRPVNNDLQTDCLFTHWATRTVEVHRGEASYCKRNRES